MPPVRCLRFPGGAEHRETTAAGREALSSASLAHSTKERSDWGDRCAVPAFIYVKSQKTNRGMEMQQVVKTEDFSELQKKPHN